MIGLDTNVLVRTAVADDPAQTRKVTALFASLTAESPAYVSLVCLAESVWVLRRRYNQPKAAILKWLTRFFDTPELIFENQPAVEEAIHVYATTTADFADCLIERASHIAGCTSTVTFDKNAAKAAGMRLL